MVVEAWVVTMKELIDVAYSRVNSYEVDASPSQSEVQRQPSEESPLAKLLNDDFLQDICAGESEALESLVASMRYTLHYVNTQRYLATYSEYVYTWIRCPGLYSYCNRYLDQ